ncbi:EAL domain-containing protein [Lichenicola cladoniae]|nr:EAL domain-containing protein [Lichenicola cladoniae]
MIERPRTRALVEMVTTLAKALDLDVVAERVETEAQFQALIAMGCHHFQGYHLSRPLSFADAM